MRLCGTYHSDILVWNHGNVGLSRPEGFCRESLEHYIARRLRREYRELSNLELYEGLSELLKREGGRGTEEPGREGRKRIFLS